MTGINLLPWRAERRKRQQREFFSMTVLALLVTAAVLMLVHFRIDRAIDWQNRRNEYLRAEIALLDQQIKEIENLETQKKRLVARMEIIQQLQASRPEIVHLFDELARTLPDGIHLLDLAQANQVLTMNGAAQSNARVSAYMHNLEASSWLQDPVLNIVESKPETKAADQRSRFTLQVRQASGKNKENPGENPS